MVQYAEIKEINSIIEDINNQSSDNFIGSVKTRAIYHLTKYKDILEGWYGDEQYHNKVEEGIEL